MRTSSGFSSMGGMKGRKDPATPASTSTSGTETLSFRPSALAAQTTATSTRSPRASSMRPFCQAVAAGLPGRPAALREAVFPRTLRLAVLRAVLRGGGVGGGVVAERVEAAVRQAVEFVGGLGVLRAVHAGHLGLVADAETDGPVQC